MLYAVFQTSPAEAREYCQQFLGVSVLLYPLLIAALLAGIGKWHDPKEWSRKRKALFVLVALFAIAYEPEVRLLYTSSSSYVKELRQYQKIMAQKKVWSDLRATTKAGRGELHVIVLGESLNRNHMSLYGYPRETTPHMDRQPDLIVFQDMISCDMGTPGVLGQALTLADSENELEFFKVPSVIEVAKAAGFKTYWLSNQQTFGPFDNLTTVLASSADEKIFMNRNIGWGSGKNSWDEVLLPVLDKILARDAATAGPKLIFIHLMGSHTAYKFRYPEKFDVFKMAKTGRPDMDTLAEYDNTVLYTDDVVSKLIQRISQTGLCATLTFISDHGEDVEGKRGHNSSLGCKAMVEIPFVIWASPEYRKQNPEVLRTLRAATKLPLMNDIFDRFIFLLTRVETPGMEIQYRLPPPGQATKPRRVVAGKYGYGSLPG